MPEPIVAIDDAPTPEDEALIADGVGGLALYVVLETLDRRSGSHSCCTTCSRCRTTRSQRSSAAVRRRFASSRAARRRVQGAKSEPDAGLAEQQRVVQAFLTADREGDFDALLELLGPEVTLRVDAGPGSPLAHPPIVGADAVLAEARRWSAMSPHSRPAIVKGVAGAVIGRPGRLFAVVAVTVAHGRITALRLRRRPGEARPHHDLVTVDPSDKHPRDAKRRRFPDRVAIGGAESSFSTRLLADRPRCCAIMAPIRVDMASDVCHDGIMDLRPYVESVHRQLAAAAETGGEDARALAERLAAPLESAVRLALQDALAAAVEEITCELAPGSVELRLRGRDPEFVVTPPPVGEPDSADEEHSPPPAALDAEDGVMSRINLRMPERLKARVEAGAAGEGLSVNAWLVRAAAAAADRGGAGRRQGRAPQAAQRYRGWAR
jgi:hypothetical protein